MFGADGPSVFCHIAVKKIIKCGHLAVEIGVAARRLHQIEMQVAVADMTIATNADFRVNRFDAGNHCLIQD